MLLIHETQKAENHSLTMLFVQGYAGGHKSLQRETPLATRKWHFLSFHRCYCSYISWAELSLRVKGFAKDVSFTVPFDHIIRNITPILQVKNLHPNEIK